MSVASIRQRQTRDRLRPTEEQTMIRTLARAALTAAALTGTLAFGASAETALKFALDWKFEGPSAPYFVAIDKGYYKAEGLDVTIDSGPGSVQGIARVA